MSALVVREEKEEGEERKEEKRRDEREGWGGKRSETRGMMGKDEGEDIGEGTCPLMLSKKERKAEKGERREERGDRREKRGEKIRASGVE